MPILHFNVPFSIQPNAQPNDGIANRTRQQQGQAQQGQQNAAEVPALADDIVQMVNHIQTTLDAKWNIEMKNWHEKKSEYKNDVLGAYSTLWTKFITAVLQKRIEQLPDYSTRIHNNPIALLIEIKSQINENTATEHPAMSMVKALKRLLNAQQEWDMSVADYLKDYKAKRDVLEAQAGITLFQHFAEVQYAQEISDIKADNNKSPDEKKKDIQLFIESGMEQVHAHTLLMGADRYKYGSLMKRLRSDYGRGVQDGEVYPADVESVVKTLNAHTWDPEYKAEKQRRTQHSKDSKDRNNKDKKDGSSEHQTSFAQQNSSQDLGQVCIKCGGPHNIKKCTKDIPKSEWFIYKAAQAQNQHSQQMETNQDNSSVSSSNTPDTTAASNNNDNNDNTEHRSVSWSQDQTEGQQHSQRRRNVASFSGFQASLQQSVHQAEETEFALCNSQLKDQVILDSGSGVKVHYAKSYEALQSNSNDNCEIRT